MQWKESGEISGAVQETVRRDRGKPQHTYFRKACLRPGPLGYEAKALSFDLKVKWCCRKQDDEKLNSWFAVYIGDILPTRAFLSWRLVFGIKLFTREFNYNLRGPPEAAFILSLVPLCGDPVRKPPAQWGRQRPALHHMDEFSESRSSALIVLWKGHVASKLNVLNILLFGQLSTGSGMKNRT